MRLRSARFGTVVFLSADERKSQVRAHSIYTLPINGIYSMKNFLKKDTMWSKFN